MLRLGRLAANGRHLASAKNNVVKSNRNRRGMCGLVAAIDDIWTSPGSGSDVVGSRAPVPILTDPAVLSSTSHILYHRGPDGMKTSFGTVGRDESTARWSMGHTRLAIVDPSSRSADMPFDLSFSPASGDNKTVHLAANGEIYNHEEVYAKCRADGWDQERVSGSDCEVIAHAYAKYGGPKTAAMLDGMFAFVAFEEDANSGRSAAFAARDPVGIKPLYYGRTSSNNPSESSHDSPGAYVFASELKALVGHVDPASVVAVPPGHYWTPQEGLVRYHEPAWLHDDDHAPWEDPAHNVTDEEVREAFTKAVQKRMMADVEYGFFLSGGVDSCIVAHDLLPLWQKEREKMGDDRPVHTYTVGMEDSPDVMAARGMVDALGGPTKVDHHLRTFQPQEVFDLIPKIVYHMETYEAELIRSAIPNWLLAERAAKEVKMVLTGEGADELFAGYLYFQDATQPRQIQNELRRIYGMLGNINLHRTDRMTMAHGLEARVPFLDTEFTRLAMSIDPAKKMVNKDAVLTNSRGREKTYLRELFEGPNADGNSIPRPVLWRAKAMQCEGVGEDWVSILQRRLAEEVSDAEMDEAHLNYPVNTPHTKEELYYRRVYDQHFHGMEHVVRLWEGGGRALGAAWKSDLYTREGLKNVDLLSHSLQEGSARVGSASGSAKRSFSTSAQVQHQYHPQPFDEEAYACATAQGYDDFEASLTLGGDDRSLINDVGTNKYHIRPQPVDPAHVFRGSCTGNPPTRRGYDAASALFERLEGLEGADLSAAVGGVFRDQRERLSRLLDLPEGAEVVLCPSGSDAEYLPVAIARALKGEDKRIANGVTQLSEIGAGSAPASEGKYFSTHVPLVGRRTEEGGDTMGGFENIDAVLVKARNQNGDVVNSAREMDGLVHTALADDVYPIIHGVFGGKTGLRDAAMPGSADSGNESLGVVDACQGRFTLEELREWLSQDSVVLFTASKFYQAPPFCGAVIVPPAIASKLRSCRVPREMLGADGLGGFLTEKELPPCLDGWRDLLAINPDGVDASNVGLALRWEAGLAGMEALAHVSDALRTEAVDAWSAQVADMVNAESELDAWCVERSIVSIRLAKDDGDGGWLGMTDLRAVHRWMSNDVSELVPTATAEERESLSTPAFIGQPVDVSDSHAIVRIALGSESLLSYLDDEARTLEGDRTAVRKLAAIAKHFETLMASGQ